MNRGELTFYLDGEQILQTKLTRMNRYAVAGYDEQKEEIVVKMVNAEDTPFDAVVKLDNVKIEPQGKVITLSALSGKTKILWISRIKLFPGPKIMIGSNRNSIIVSSPGLLLYSG